MVSASATSRYAGAIRTWRITPHSNTPSLRVAGFEDDEDEDEYEAPGEATVRRVFLDRISIFGKAYTFRMDKNTKIVVCGAGGFIGGHLVADLLRQGCANIRAVDLKPASRKPIAGSTAK